MSKTYYACSPYLKPKKLQWRPPQEPRDTTSRTADGKNYYNVKFIQYLNDEGKIGRITFYSAPIQ